MITFFSSDSRPLYKTDILEVFSLPVGYVVHFRYEKKYVNLDISKGQNLLNQEGIIFYSMGNDLSKPIEERQVNNLSIRLVKIVKFFESEKTGLIHFYLELQSFADRKISNGNNENLPPNKFVSDLLFIDGKNNEWHERIEEAKQTFRNQLFFNFSMIDTEQEKLVIPKFDEKENRSYYELQDEESYLISFSFYDDFEKNKLSDTSLKGYQSIKLETNKYFEVNAPKEIVVGAIKDDRRFNLDTYSLSTSKQDTILHFSTKVIDDSNSIPLSIPVRIRIKKSSSRANLFGLYTLLATIGILGISIISKQLEIDFSSWWWLALIVCLILIFISAKSLYHSFNKK